MTTPTWSSWSSTVTSRRGLLLLLAFLETVCTRVGISQGYDQAFIQADGGELRYLADAAAAAAAAGISGSVAGSSSNAKGLSGDFTKGYEDEDGTITVLGSPIRFEPTELYFHEQPLGMPILRKVRVHNLNMQSSIQMLSISGNTIHFHCSFFTDKVIPPLGNTTFDVVFLGREEGPVENTLYIHTSAGSFRFVVKATGTPNPYRLKPLVGVRMPLNSSFSPLIELHNPHAEPIQVLEMYSSGGDLHLELPSGETEGPQALWQIPPYQTKSVMKANFVARMENNHTAYIRIKTNTTGAEFLYLPLEIEVSSQPGIYCPQELIDFGMLPTGGSAGGSAADPRTIKLLVLNSGNKPIPIQNVIATPVTEALSINFQPLKVASDTLRPSVIAEITFDPSLVSEEGLYTGKIVIKSRNSQFKVTLPYRAHVLRGSLKVNESSTHFHLEEEEQEDNHNNNIVRNLTVTNEFGVPVVVHKLTLPPKARKYFSVSAPFKPLVIRPGETVALTELTLKKEARTERLLLDSHLTLHTNISNIDVPLRCFHGKLSTFFPGSPSQDLLDFGTLGMGEKRDLYFTVINRNPVGVTLRSWGSNMTGSLVELMGVAEGNETQILQRQNFSGMVRKLIIPPGHYMVFRIGILTNNEEGETDASVFVETDYHEFDVQFRFKVARGSLHTVPRELIFEPAFPGKRVELKLKVYSSFAQEMIIETVMPVPRDPRFIFWPATEGKGATVASSATILSGQKNFLGKVVFDPAAVCRKDESCYAGFSTTGKFGREWFQGLTLPPNMADADIAIIHTLNKRLLDTINPSSSFNITLHLDTDQVRGFLFKARASLVFPRVLDNNKNNIGDDNHNNFKNVSEDDVEDAEEEEESDVDDSNRKTVHFPLTQVGNSSFREVMLSNPSNQDVYFHLVPLSVYPNGAKVANMLPSSSSKEANVTPVPRNYSSNVGETFRVLSVLDSNTKTPLRSYCDEVESRLGVTAIHADTKAFVLKPGHTAKVRIRFRPSAAADHFRSAIFVRNNLTGVEVIELAAQSVYGSLSFGTFKTAGKSPVAEVAATPLRFEVKEKHLKDCTPENRSKSRFSHHQPVLTVRRGFRLKNTGMTSLYVSGFDIEGEPCEGFGFKVLNCEGFSLKPEEQREIDVAFTPDFTLSVVVRRLSIRTSLSPRILNFTMEATVPSSLMAQCAASLPRPPWEHYLYYGVNGLMFLLFVCVVAAAYCESDRIARCTAMLLSATAPRQIDNNGLIPPDAAPFDLRGIPQQVSSELRQRLSSLQPPPCRQQQQQQQQQQQDQPGWMRINARHHVSSKSQQQQQNQSLFSATFSVARRVVMSFWGFVRRRLPWDGNSAGAAAGTSARKSISLASVAKPSPQPPAAAAATTTPVNQSRKNKKSAKSSGGKKSLGKSLSNNSGLNNFEDLETSSTTTEESSNAEDDSSYSKGQKDNDLMFEQSQQQQQQTNLKKGKGKNNNNNIKKQKSPTEAAAVSKQQEEDVASKKMKEKPKLCAKAAVTECKDAKKQPVIVASAAKTPIGGIDVKAAAASAAVVVKKQQQQPEKQQARVKPSEQQQQGNNRSTPSPTTVQQQQQQLANNDRQPRMQRSTSSSEFDAKSTTATIGSLPTTLLPPVATAAAKQKAKVTPVGKILPEPKKPENLGAQYGPIGAKKSVLPYPRQSTWSNSPAEARPPQQSPFGPIAHPEKSAISSGFGAGSGGSVSPGAPVAATELAGSGSGGSLHRSNSSPYHQQHTSLGGGGLGAGEQGLLQQQQSPNRTSLMQKLQLERRQRMEEYLREQTDWPGFNDQQISYIDDLWDSHPLTPSATGGVGNRAVSAAVTTATAIEDVWPTASWDLTGGINSSHHSADEIFAQQQQQIPLLDDHGLGFNPLQMASVWGSPTKRQRQEQEDLELQQQLLHQQQLQQQQQRLQLLQQQQQQQQQGYPWSNSLFHKRDQL